MLTRAQHDLLTYLNDYLTEHGFAPSVEEMRVHFSVASKSTIQRMLGRLQERGFIRRLKFRQRAIEVLRLYDQPVIVRERGKLIGSNIRLPPAGPSVDVYARLIQPDATPDQGD